MCFEPNSSIKFEAEGTFYKVFNLGENDELYGEFFHITGVGNIFMLKRSPVELVPYPINTWIIAVKTNVPAYETADKYTSGFHGFPDLAGAKEYGCNTTHQKIFKCRYRGARIAGTIYSADISAEENIVIVADEMMILGEVKDEDNIY